MAVQQQLTLLKQGIEVWNQWRKEHPDENIDLSGADLGAVLGRADLSGANLSGANLSGANLFRADLMGADLSGANLSGAFLSRASLSRVNLSGANLFRAGLIEANFNGADLSGADLSGAILNDTNLSGANLFRADLNGAYLNGADLSGADLSGAILNDTNLSGANLFRADLNGAYLKGADLSGADLSRANLIEADFSGANLSGADLNNTNLSGSNLSRSNLSGLNLSEKDLSGANLSEANLTRAILVKTNLENAVLSSCSIYGIAAWDVQLAGAKQEDLVITPPDEPTITVDNLEVAQFIYLLLNNPKIRDVINTIGRKGVLILGRFTPERKAILDAIREKLRTLNFLPIVFDFEHPTAHDFSETIMTLAGLSCFIIADITNPKSSPLELQATVPNYMIPFVPIIQEGEQPFAMFTDLQNRYRDWVLDTLLYDTPSNLINVLERAIVQPALARQAELLLIKAQGWRTRHIKDYS